MVTRFSDAQSIDTDFGEIYTKWWNLDCLMARVWEIINGHRVRRETNIVVLKHHTIWLLFVDAIVFLVVFVAQGPVREQRASFRFHS